MKWFIKCLKNCLVFRGRARRMEYWTYVVMMSLSLVIGAFVILGLSFAVPSLRPVMLIVGICAMIVAYLAQISAAVRRLHDIGKSGWWFFGFFIVGVVCRFMDETVSDENVKLSADLVYLVSIVYFLYLLCKSGDKGDNKYGPDPKELDE